MSKIYVVYGTATIEQCVCGSKASATTEAKKAEAKVKGRDNFTFFESKIKGKLDVEWVYMLFIHGHIALSNGDDLDFHAFYKTREELIQGMFEHDIIINFYGSDGEDYEEKKARENELVSILFSDDKLRKEGYLEENGFHIRIIPVVLGR